MDIDNLCTQADLNEDTLVNTLSTRYKNGQIYTHSGLMLLSINPYTELDLYSPAVSEMYRKRVDNLQPHIFSLLDSCLDAAPVFGPHSIVISGESGSGKTETARRMLAYLEVPMIESVETILEAFGNAWTVKNDNSSRFGKLISLNQVISIETFLLEKSRVTAPSDGRNFHIFYYINAHKQQKTVNDYIDCSIHDDPEIAALHTQEYLKVKHAFAALQIDFKHVENVLLGILELGSVKISEGRILNDDALKTAATHLGLTSQKLEEYLLHRIINVCNESIVCDNSDGEARMLRDSVARLLYEGLFSVLTAGINDFLANNPIPVNNINILDIFGFEDMMDNGLDQFCINWCNEKIYDEFVRGTFEHQKSILATEGIVSDDHIEKECRMNPSCIEMIERKCGLCDLIAEESFINGTPDSLGVKISNLLKEQVQPGNLLVIEHFAGAVKYRLDDFIGKNKEKGRLQDIYGKCDDELLRKVVEHGCSSTSVVKSFRRDLDALFARLTKTKIKYVKCIKPNSTKSPLSIDERIVMAQLRANGVLQSVELSRSLYPYIMYIDEFDERYGEFITDSLEYIRGSTRYFFNNRTFNVLEMSMKYSTMFQHWTVREVCRCCIGKVQEELKLALESEQRLRKERINFESLENLMEINEEAKEIKDETVAEDIEKITHDAHPLTEFESAALEVLCDQLADLPLVESDVEPSDSVAELRSDGSVSMEALPVIVDQRVDIHESCNLRIKSLEEELERYKKFSVACNNCQVLNQKYKIQSQQLLAKQFIEMELERVKQRLRAYEDSDDSSVESASAYNIFGCLVQLYLDYCPVYSSKDIPRDEMLSLAHAIHFILGMFSDTAFEENLGICLDEINKRLADFEENISLVAFVLSNLIELRIIIDKPRTAQAISLIDNVITTLFQHLCSMQRASLDDILPSAILDYQHLKEFRVRESIYKKIFAGPSVTKLVDHLTYFYNLNAYFYLPDVAIINNLSYLLSYMDYVSFNALLTKRKFLNTNRCIQIKYNLSEIERFCFNVSFHHGFCNMAYMREAARLAMAVSGGSASTLFNEGDESTSVRRNISENSFTTFDNFGNACSFSISGTESVESLIENSLLNPAQIKTILELFEGPPLKVPIDTKSLKKYIDEPKPVIPNLSEITTQSKFVKPKYLPDKSLKSIFKTFKQGLL